MRADCHKEHQMTTYTLFTDPHLGTRRAAHTTRESSKRLTLALFKQAWDVIEDAEKPICLGDLFDRAFNDESILVQGYEIASNCMWTLAGNHDETNREGTITSLRALQEMGCPVISSPSMSSPYFFADGPMYFVPHHASQELFEQAMREAAEHAARERAGRASVLMLHCNYDQPFATEDDTLNLSPAVAQKLLESFDYIFLGHEHKPSILTRPASETCLTSSPTSWRSPTTALTSPKPASGPRTSASRQSCSGRSCRT
jgi:DNA repair exonuclease SbcCD nuclease subunit